MSGDNSSSNNSNTGDVGSFSVDPSQALFAAKSFGLDGTAGTDSFGSQAANATTTTTTNGQMNGDARDEQPRKRLRRAVADDAGSQAGDSNRSTPGPSGADTPSLVLPEQLARVRVESQPGSSSSSAHGGADEGIAPSSPVQATTRARPPTIQDSPSSVIDLRSPEQQARPLQPTSSLANFAGTAGNPIQPQQQPRQAMGVQQQHVQQQYMPPTSNMFPQQQRVAPPQYASPQAYPSYGSQPSSQQLPPQHLNGSPAPTPQTAQVAWQRFSQVTRQWPEHERVQAWQASNGNEKAAMALLMHQNPLPRASPTQAAAGPGQSAYFAGMSNANRPPAYPQQATVQQHNPYSYSTPPAGAPRFAGGYGTTSQQRVQFPQGSPHQQPLTMGQQQYLQQQTALQQLQHMNIPLHRAPPGMAQTPEGTNEYMRANQDTRVRYWQMYLHAQQQNQNRQQHIPTQRRPIPQMTSRVQARPAPQQQNQSVLSRSLALAGAGAFTSSTKKKKRKTFNSDSEDNDVEYDSAGSGDEYGSVTPAQMARREQVATEFFNEATRDEISELTGCTPAQATMLMKLRPFASAGDFRQRTRKQKGIGNNLMDNYLEVVAGMNEVDTVLTECETIGRELATVMKIWVQGAEASSGPGEAQASDAGLSLTHISKEMLDRASNPNMHPQVKAAFEGYLREQPPTMAEGVQLKDYQLLGLNWLCLLYRRQTSCILADEMGLGKTVQVIALLSHLKTLGEQGPHIVIVPSSTLENWMREFGVFATNLNVQSYYGSQAERAELRHEMKANEDLDVVVTTYNIATSSADDQKFLRKRMRFNIAVFDEGHMLKNSQSKKYRDLMQIRARWRLLLTGTPLQNNLQELVSLLSFILPDQFRDASESLRAIFKANPGSHANLLSRERISRAKKMMTPFVLRRKKAQVLKDLPKKIEKIEWCDMTDLQKEVYIEALERSKSSLLEKDDSEIDEDAEEDAVAADDDAQPATTKKNKKNVSSTKTGNKSDQSSSTNVLMDLRKASCHPMLFRRLYTDDTIRQMSRDCLKELDFQDRNVDYIYEDMEIMNDFELHRFAGQYRYLQKYALKNKEWMSAGKIEALQRLIPQIRSEGNRLLLFSQFTQVLDILQDVLDTMDVKWLKLTGATSVAERQGLVDEFNEDESIGVFLLSTRAGGLGLNLTAANYVIFYDQDYNPHNDRQAEDRAYRIGQTKDVTVIKLITRGSLEEDMRELATKKLLLDQNVSGQSNDLPSSSDAATAKKGAEEGEADQAQLEKKVRTSLLSNLKKRFEDEAKGITDTKPSAPTTSDAAANADVKPDVKPDSDAKEDVKKESVKSEDDVKPAPDAATDEPITKEN